MGSIKVTSEIQQGMHIDTNFGFTELYPGTELKAQTDCNKVEYVDHIVQIKPKW